MKLPTEIIALIHQFAAYWPDEWIPVKEYKQRLFGRDYGWVPQPLSVEDLIDLPMW